MNMRDNSNYRILSISADSSESPVVDVGVEDYYHLPLPRHTRLFSENDPLMSLSTDVLYIPQKILEKATKQDNNIYVIKLKAMPSNVEVKFHKVGELGVHKIGESGGKKKKNCLIQ